MYEYSPKYIDIIEYNKRYEIDENSQLNISLSPMYSPNSTTNFFIEDDAEENSELNSYGQYNSFFPLFEESKQKKQKNIESAIQQIFPFEEEKTKDRTNENNFMNTNAELNLDKPMNNFNYLVSPQNEQKEEKKKKELFIILKPHKKLGRGNKKNNKKWHNSEEIGNATRNLIISCKNDVDKIAQKLAKNSTHFRLKKLFRPTITKVTKINKNSKKNIGIFGSHEKMRDLFKTKLSVIYSEYTFPKRVKGDSELGEIENKFDRIKRKEELLQSYKNHIINISNIKEAQQNDLLIHFFNLTFVDFLKIYIHYDGEKEQKKEIIIDDYNKISLEGFGLGEKVDWFYDEFYAKLRKHIIKIINGESRDK